MKPFVVVVVALCVGYALAFPELDRSVDDQWESFKAQYNKKYDGPEEHLRKATFAKSLQKIEQHNKLDKSWEIGLNEFSDMTFEERQVAFDVQTGERKLSELFDNNETDDFEMPYQVPTADDDEEEEDIPESYDLRTHKCMPPVKNRGQCKSGDWAFAAVAAVEFFRCKSTGSLELLSEQQVLDCTVYTDVSGCTKGRPRRGLAYLGSYGTLSAAAYPFTSGTSGKTDACKYCSLTEGSSSTKIAAQPFGREVKGGEETMREKLFRNGILAVTTILPIGKIESILEYKTGVYDPSDAAYQHTAEFSVNIVGWGTDSKTAKKYWIVRNSLGKTWGQNGYFLLVRGENAGYIEQTGASYILPN